MCRCGAVGMMRTESWHCWSGQDFQSLGYWGGSAGDPHTHLWDSPFPAQLANRERAFN